VADRSPQLLIGTSGWIYPHWKRRFYPPDLKAGSELEFYAERFPTVEMNYSFYRLPERKDFAAWRRRSPDGFVFAVKASRYLTHMKRLKDPAEPLRRMLQRAEGLGPKLGPVLFQFPNRFAADIGRLEAFLKLLRRRRGLRCAFEFRHQSWLDVSVFELLESGNHALCIPVGMRLPREVRLTADWTYLRLHKGQRGIGFSDDELRTWAGHIETFRRRRADVYVYFNNDTDGHAIRDAKRLRSLLRIP